MLERLEDRALLASFQGLGTLGGDYPASDVWDVSDDGSVVVGRGENEFQSVAIRWTSATGMESLGLLPGWETSQSHAVSGDGSVIVGVGWTESFSAEPFRWTSLEGMDILSGFDWVSDVSKDGSVVVGGQSGEAIRWTFPGTIDRLGVPPGWQGSGALSVSADGSVVVGNNVNVFYDEHGNYFEIEAFRWTSADNQMVRLGDVPQGWRSSSAYAVSADGSVVVGRLFDARAGFYEAFRWTSADGQIVGLGGYQSSAYGVSGDGAVVVGQMVDLEQARFVATIWDEQHGVRDLKSVLVDAGVDMSGWFLDAATAISSDGSAIVGFGENPQGFREGWIARLDAEPDIVAKDLDWNATIGGVDIAFAVVGTDIVGESTAALYWAPSNLNCNLERG